MDYLTSLAYLIKLNLLLTFFLFFLNPKFVYSWMAGGIMEDDVMRQRWYGRLQMFGEGS
jgi:hypothetical protein